MTPAPETLRVVIFREADQWLAQALERDVAVQAENLKDMVNRLTLAIEAEGPGLAALAPAPKYFQDLWPHRAGDFTPVAPVRLTSAIALDLLFGMAI